MNIERKFGWQLSKENVLSERALLKNKAIIYVALVYSFYLLAGFFRLYYWVGPIKHHIPSCFHFLVFFHFYRVSSLE